MMMLGTASSAANRSQTNKRVLVTGAGGFVGAHLVPRLVEIFGAKNVFAADRRSEGGPQHIFLDLADVESIDRAVKLLRPDIIVHLAGEASVTSAANAGEMTWRINLVGTFELASALSRWCPAATFLFASSTEVYGAAFRDGIVAEATRPQPLSVYAQSKLAAEYALAATLSSTGRLIVARPSNHIGEGQDVRFAVAAFADQIVKAERGEGSRTLRVGNLESKRDFMDVKDVVEAYVKLLETPFAAGARLTFNVASGQSMKVRVVLDILRELSAVQTDVAFDPLKMRPSEIPEVLIDATALKKATSWEPRIPLRETLSNVLESARLITD